MSISRQVFREMRCRRCEAVLSPGHRSDATGGWANAKSGKWRLINSSLLASSHQDTPISRIGSLEWLVMSRLRP